MPATYLIRKLEQFAGLSADEQQALHDVARQKVRSFVARDDIVREGDRPASINLILEGFACRYKMLEDGRRQIVAILVPGDTCDMRMFILREMDHSIAALSPIKVAEIPGAQILELTDRSVRLTRAFWWSSLVEEAISREWVVNLGQRDALERVAHLFCEVFVRLKAVGLVESNRFDLPMTQVELADASGMTPVHANRTLQELRAQGLISLKGKNLEILDFRALQSVALFNPNYLHLNREGAGLEPNGR